MLKLIIFKELKEIIGSSKFFITFATCSLLIIFAFFIGAKEYKTAQNEYRAATIANLNQYQGVTNWEDVNQFDIFSPPQPLSALVVGITNDMGNKISLYTSNTSASFLANDSRYSQQPVFAIFRFLDLEFVFQIILSLFAILFAYDAINGEKERGTLSLTFANSMPRAIYIGGKLIGSFLALTVPLLIPILIGVLLLPLMGVILSSDEWLRLILFVLTGFLYIGVFLTLSVLVSTLTLRSSSAFLFLLVVWVLSILVLPRASILIAGNLVEVPTTMEINSQITQFSRQSFGGINSGLSEYYTANMPRPDPQPGEDPEVVQARLQERMADFQVELNQYLNDFYSEVSVEIDDLRTRLNEDRDNKQMMQQQLAFNLARISPASAFTFAATTLSGTSLDLKEDYYQQANSFHATFTNFISNKTGIESGPRLNIVLLDTEAEEEEEKDNIDPLELPVFEYQQKALTTILSNALPDIALLLFFNIIFFCGSFIAFLRYDLR